MSTITLGKNCTTYWGASGAQANTLIGNVTDETLEFERDEIDASARDSGDWEEVVSSMKKASINFTVRWKKTDAAFVAIRDAWLNGTAIAMLFLDGLKTVVGSQGLDADFTVLKFSIKRELRGIVTVDVSVKPTPSTRAPTWYTVPTP